MLNSDFINVQEADFNIQHEYKMMRNNNSKDGAIVFFTGLVRDYNQGNHVTGLYLDHYPSMTQTALTGIVSQAKARWPVSQVRLIHRVGQLNLADQIVFVAVSSQHRESAFEACAFIMDYLKIQAPFWKKETTHQGDTWVSAVEKDTQALQKWQ
ncbi:molybdopterin synthase catalytic subunit MoaE [Pseudomonas sp. HK3]